MITSGIYLSFFRQMRTLGHDPSMMRIFRAYRLMFLVLVSLMVISCGGLRAGERDNTLLIEKQAEQVEKADKSLPAFVMKKEIRTTITDSTDDTPGVRLRTFLYEEYENALGTLPDTSGYSFNAYLIRQMDGSGAVVGTSLSIERWSRPMNNMKNTNKRVDTWKFHDNDMDGVPDKVVIALIIESPDNTLLELRAEELEIDEEVSGYYRRMELELRERGLSDAFK